MKLATILALAFIVGGSTAHATGNTCVLTNTASSACSTKICSLSAIAADSTHANWTTVGGTGCNAVGYVPSNDNVIVPDGYVLTADQSWIVGTSAAGTLGYVIAVTPSGGSSITTASSTNVTFSGLVANVDYRYNQPSATFTYNTSGSGKVDTATVTATGVLSSRNTITSVGTIVGAGTVTGSIGQTCTLTAQYTANMFTSATATATLVATNSLAGATISALSGGNGFETPPANLAQTITWVPSKGGGDTATSCGGTVTSTVTVGANPSPLTCSFPTTNGTPSTCTATLVGQGPRSGAAIDLSNTGRIIVSGASTTLTARGDILFTVPNYTRDGVLKTANFVRLWPGASVSGTAGQTCNIAFIGYGNSGSTYGSGTLTLAATNTIAPGTAVSVSSGGSGYQFAVSAGTLSSGTATCSGTVDLHSSMSSDNFTLTNGATLTFDNSLSTGPQIYSYHAYQTGMGEGTYQGRRFVSSCSATSRCTITANVSGAGNFQQNSYYSNGQHDFWFTDFTNIGSFLTPAGVNPMEMSNCTWSANTGTVTAAPTAGVNFRIQNTAFWQLGSATTFPYYANSIGDGTAPTGSPTAEQILAGNFFYKTVQGANATATAKKNMSITENFFADGIDLYNSGGAPALIQWNIFRWDTTTTTGSSWTNDQVPATYQDNLFMVDMKNPNVPHTFNAPAGAVTLNRNLFMVTQFDAGGAGGVQFYPSGSFTGAHTLTNNVSLPGLTGCGQQQLTSQQASNTTETMSVDHNTYSAICTATAHSAQVALSEGATHCCAGAYTTLRSNLAWQPNRGWGSANVSGFLKAYSNDTSSSIITDILTAGTATDYNFSSPGLTNTVPSCSNCTNQQNGYNGKFSNIPGPSGLNGSSGSWGATHDQFGLEPMFVDITRTLATFETAYLGLDATLSPATYSTATSYSFGQVVQYANSSYWGGKNVLYKCIVASGCPGSVATSYIGSGSFWLWSWEIYSLTQIAAEESGTCSTCGGVPKTYVDGALSYSAGGVTYTCTVASPCNPIQARLIWIMAGYQPLSTMFRGAGHDQRSPGAVDAPPLTPMFGAIIN